MRKAIVGLLWVLILSCSMFSSVYAVDADPPMWERLGYESEADFCREYLVSGNLNREKVSRSLTHEEYDQLSTIYVDQIDYVQSPEFLAEQGYDSIEALYEDSPYYDSVEMAINRLAFQETMRIWEAQREAAWQQAERIRLGLQSQGVSVILNGKSIPFAGASPEYTSDTVFVPVHQMAEAFGCKISFDAMQRIFTVEGDDITLSFPLNSTMMTCIDGEISSAIYLPVAVYEREGTVYVPMRAFAEALGYMVSWDARYETVVILDHAALVHAIDGGFSKINRVFATMGSRKIGEAYQMAIDVAGTLTVFDTIDGNQSYEVNTNIVIVQDGKNSSIDVQLDLQGLFQWISSKMEDADQSDEIEELDLLAAALQDANLQVILNYDEDAIYFRSPVLIGLVSRLAGTVTIPGGTASLAENAWYKIENAGLQSMDQMFFSSMDQGMLDLLEGSAMSIGELLYVSECASANGQPDIYFYERLQRNASDVYTVLGDQQFSQNGEKDTLTLDSKKLSRDQENMRLMHWLEDADIHSFSLQIEILKDGSAAGTIEVRQGAEYSAETLSSFGFSCTNSQVEFMLSHHIKNNSEIALHIRLNESDASSDITFLPPEEALVIDLQTILGV